MDISTVVVDYVLWDFRQWLPRSVRGEGYFSTGSEVSSTDVPNMVTPFSRHWTFTIEEVRFRGEEEAGPTRHTSEELLRRWSEEGDSVYAVGGEVDSAGPGEAIVILPRDRRELATSDLLPPPLWDESAGGISREETDEMGAKLATIGTVEGTEEGVAGRSPWFFEPPVTTVRLLRYNAVEGLSVGTRLRRDFDWGRGVLTLRAGTRRLEPDANLTVERDHSTWRVRGSVYHSLLTTDLDQGGLARSADGLLTGKDSADYYLAAGAAVEILPGRKERPWASLRLFAERQQTFLPGGYSRRGGAVLRWKPWWGGFSRWSVTGGADLYARATAGDDSNLKAAATGSLIVPLAARWSAGLEAGAARTWGDPAPQDLWYLGGTGDWLRGYPARALVTSSVLRARAELQRPVRFLRGSLFADWAGADGQDLHSAGFGLSFMDGIMRLDIARGLSSRVGPTGETIEPGWRIHVRGDATF